MYGLNQSLTRQVNWEQILVYDDGLARRPTHQLKHVFVGVEVCDILNDYNATKCQAVLFTISEFVCCISVQEVPFRKRDV